MSYKELPGASNALTFGILSIVLSIFCCGPFGAIFSFIGLSNARKAERAYEAEPEAYLSIENIKTAKTLSYIGIAIAAIMLIFWIFYFAIIIAAVMSAGVLDF